MGVRTIRDATKGNARMKKAVLAVLFLVALPVPARAEDDLLLRRMEELRKLFRETPGGFEEFFDASFLQAVPPVRLRNLLRSLHASHGPCTEAVLVQRTGKHAGVFDLFFGEKTVMRSTLTVQSQAPFKVVGWWLGPPMPQVKGFAGLVEKFEELGGTVGFAAAKLGEGEPAIVASLAPDEPLAIGSTFKLYVLGALAGAVEAKRMEFETVLRLREAWKSLPSGQLQDWPDGAPVTAHTLATLMISVSDNTATDQLLFTLCREEVEKMLEPMGNRHAARNRPFLSTAEMFKLKLDPGNVFAKKYLGLDVEARRAFLETEVRDLPRDKLDFSRYTVPLHVDTLEWFASATDIVRALDFLRRKGAEPGLEPILDILAVNKGVEISSGDWPYAGFKGGSEPGVVNGAFLLRSKTGTWFAVSAGWMNTEKSVDTARFFGLVQKAFRLLAAEAEGEGEKK